MLGVKSSQTLHKTNKLIEYEIKWQKLSAQ